MLQVARLSPRVLGESAQLVSEFLYSQINDDGGFCDRDGNSDLYYTSFGLQALVALQMPLPSDRVANYLSRFDDGKALDVVHLASLVRSWATIGYDEPLRSFAGTVAGRLETHRSADGGYEVTPGAERGTLYGCFLALGLYQDLGRNLPHPQRMLACIHAQRAPDGGYANGPDMPVGLTPSSAAAAVLLRHLGQKPDAQLRDWLLERYSAMGGFVAAPAAPVPDLLSTATALHALTGMHADLDAIREPCLDFVDSLWVNRGGFCGSWEDDTLDCEYTYYALLALGHLSL